MRQSYKLEFEANYQANLNDKNNSIKDAQALVASKASQVEETQAKNKRTKALNSKLLKQKYALFLKRVAFRAITYFMECEQRKRRVKICSRNMMYRRKLRLLFGSWRGVPHQWFKESINIEAHTYFETKRTEHLITWENQVDALKLYMAQLQEKIRVEVIAREQLAQTYENSLNKGVNQLNSETQILAQNPLIKEISLIVAQELVNRSKQDPSILRDLNLSQSLRH